MSKARGLASCRVALRRALQHKNVFLGPCLRRQAATSARHRSLLHEDIEAMDAVMLGRAARRDLAEGYLVEERWQRYAARAVQLVNGLSFSETARLAAAFSTARVRDFDLYTQFSSRTMHCLRDPGLNSAGSKIQAVDLRRLALAFGRVRSFDSQLMEALVPFIEENVEDFRPRDLARIADAYARMPVQSPELFALVADALPAYLYDLEPTELAGLCRSFAQAAIYCAELVDALCMEVRKRLRSFGAHECLIFLEGLSHLHAGLSEELQRRDTDTIGAVAEQLVRVLSTLGASELIRAFGAFVRLDHYEPQLMHHRLVPSLGLKLNQLQQSGPSGAAFTQLAELLHSLSLLPAQSHASAELATASITALLRGGLPRSRPEPGAVALAVAALVQLGQEDEELLRLLCSAVIPASGQQASTWGATRARGNLPDMLALASYEELIQLRQAFGLCSSATVVAARNALDGELTARETAEPLQGS